VRLIRRGDADFGQIELRVAGVEGDEAGRVFNACGMQQHALDHAEDGGVRTDAKGQGEDGDDGEERSVKKTKQSLPEICQKHGDLSTYSSELIQKRATLQRDVKFTKIAIVYYSPPVIRSGGCGRHPCT